MGEDDIKAKRSQRRRRNFMTKVMNEIHKPKVFDPRKQEYKRVKLNPRDIESNSDEYKTTGKDS